MKSAERIEQGVFQMAPEKSPRKLTKNRLTKAKQKYYFDLLMKARQDFSRQVQFHAAEALKTQKDSAGERAGMATHMADLGSDNSRHDLELGLMSSEVEVLEMIEEALQRIHDNEYGICLECGSLIPEARLAAKPYARYCTKCKEQRESLEDPGSRSR